MTGSEILQKAKTRRTKVHRFKFSDGSVAELTIRALSLTERLQYEQDRELQGSAPGKDRANAVAGAECLYIHYGVIDPETGEPMFSVAEAKQFREAEYHAVQDLLTDIHILSGGREPIKWEQMEVDVANAFTSSIYEALVRNADEFVHDDERERWELRKENMKAEIEDSGRVLIQDLHDLIWKKIERGEEDPSTRPPSDEQLGE